MPEIRLKNITKRFGKAVAVENLNITIEDREFVTLLGPSGCGKTTTLRMIAGLETPTEGEIFIDGSPLPQEGKDLAALRAEVGMVFQSFNLFAHKTVLENVASLPVNIRVFILRIRL